MSLIDVTYFVGEIAIAQRSDLAVEENLGLFIDKYEPILLNLLLGEDFNALFQAGLEEDPIPAKWTTISDRVKSAIADFVYCKYITDQATKTTGVGEVAPSTENGQVVAPTRKLVRAWNEMVDFCLTFNVYMEANADTYPEWTSTYIATYCGYPEIYTKINSFGL